MTKQDFDTLKRIVENLGPQRRRLLLRVIKGECDLAHANAHLGLNTQARTSFDLNNAWKSLEAESELPS